MVWRGALIRFVGSTLARGQTLENSTKNSRESPNVSRKNKPPQFRSFATCFNLLTCRPQIKKRC